MARHITTALAALAIALPASLAPAQAIFTEASGDVEVFGGSPGESDRRATPVTRDEMEDYIEILRLSDEQGNVARDMYEGFRADVAEMTAEFREKMQVAAEKAKESQDFNSLMKTIGEINDDRSKRTEQLRDTFLGDIKLLLDDQQMARWGLVEESRRRARVLPTLRVSGANVDLIDLTRDTLPDRTETFRDTLETYASRLDAHLTEIIENTEQRDKLFDKRGDLGALELSVSENQKELRELNEERREIELAIRALNDRTLRLLTAELGAQDAGTLTHAFNERAYPEVFRATYTDRALDAALAMDTLDEAQRDQLAALKEKIASARDSLNAKWIRTIRAEDERERAGVFLAGGNAVIEIHEATGDGQERELTDLEKARNARLDKESKALDRLRETLNDDQLAMLPKKPEPNRRRFNMVGAGDAIVFEQSVTADEDGNTQTDSDIQVITPESPSRQEKESDDR